MTDELMKKKQKGRIEKMPKKKSEEITDCLVGHYFVSFDDDGKGGRRAKNQGRIIKKITEKQYLAELYSWVDGRVTCRKAIADIFMWNYDFYDDHDVFVDAASETFAAYKTMDS